MVWSGGGAAGKCCPGNGGLCPGNGLWELTEEPTIGGSTPVVVVERAEEGGKVGLANL